MQLTFSITPTLVLLKELAVQLSGRLKNIQIAKVSDWAALFAYMSVLQAAQCCIVGDVK